MHCLCAGEFLSWHWTCGADSTWGQVQPHTTTARWYVLSAVWSHSRPSKNGMLLDVIQYAMWQSVPDFWHRTVACVTRYSHVVDWSDCGPWSICTAVRTVACITRYRHVVDWSDCGPWSVCTAVRKLSFCLLLSFMCFYTLITVQFNLLKMY